MSEERARLFVTALVLGIAASMIAYGLAGLLSG